MQTIKVPKAESCAQMLKLKTKIKWSCIILEQIGLQTGYRSVFGAEIEQILVNRDFNYKKLSRADNIESCIADADLVIGDITSCDPAAYYGLGYARGKSKLVIQTCRSNINLSYFPINITNDKNSKILFYSDDSELAEKVRKAIDEDILPKLNRCY